MGSLDTSAAVPAVAAPAVQLVDRFIDEPRPLRVAVIGGGLSGITAGILLPIKVPGVQLTIYEKNKELSGTWLVNTYPGVRCDIPSHAYQSTFEPNPEWKDVFSYGAEIRDYWQALAHKYDVYKYAQLGKRVAGADWDQAAGEWTLTVSDVDTEKETQATFDVIITAVGRFNNWKLPDYPGLTDFRGHLRHAQDWDPSFDPTGKRVAVIGNGASGIQLVTNLQKTVGQLDHYVRNRTWIASSWAGDERLPTAQPYSQEQIEGFKKDPKVYLAFRKDLEARYWRRFAGIFKDSPDNDHLREHFIQIMTKRIEKKPELIKDLIPDFSPNCRRLTPGPGYLEALTEDNVDYIRNPIKRFTEKGIETADGTVREVDAIICATGADQSQAPPFPVRANGKELAEVWQSKGHPYTYLGTATPGFPNLFYLLGPNSSGPSGTVPQSVETQLSFLSRILRKIGHQGVKSIVPQESAADEFEAWATAFFAKTVLSESCSSWYNGGTPGGFISGMWPGSSVHLSVVRREPRWEDWEYSYITEGQQEGPQNRFAWYFGNGWTKKESDPETDIVAYLHVPGTVDLKDVHESWHSIP